MDDYKNSKNGKLKQREASKMAEKKNLQEAPETADKNDNLPRRPTKTATSFRDGRQKQREASNMAEKKNLQEAPETADKNKDKLPRRPTKTTTSF